jgi:hypothetical protein
VEVAPILERMQAATGQVGRLLMELDEERDRRSADASLLRGDSAVAWQQGCRDLLKLWADFSQISEKIQAWTAQASPSPGNRNGPGLVAVALVESRAEGEVSALLQRVEGVAERLTSIWVAREVVLPQLADIEETLSAAERKALAAGLRRPNDARAAGDELARLRTRATEDPLALDLAAIKQLAGRAQRVHEELDTETNRLEEAAADLDRLDADLDTVATVLAAAQSNGSESAVKISGAVTFRAEVGALLERTARLSDQVSAARSGATSQRDMAATASRLRPLVDRLQDEARDAAEHSEAGLNRRRELRGRLEAYRAKAAAGGRDEDLELEHLYRAATDALYSAPCDLAEAERRVTAYQQSILRPAGRERL